VNDPPPAGTPYVYVLRGDLVESVHAVAACASDTAGCVTLRRGDIETPVFLRSTAKPFIAAAVVRDGTAAHFGFDSAELAVIAASHNGEPSHVALVRGILAKIGLGDDALLCGAHAPYSEAAAAALAARGERPSAVHSNCSGKHAGILASCVAHGEDVATYREPAHPAERRILDFCARLLGEPSADALPLGIDGCGIPVFATSLRRAAHAFARMAAAGGPGSDLEDEDGAALALVRDAMAAWPAHVGGSGRFDTALIATTGGRIVSKGGAEGVHGAALRAAGLGLVLKIIDGAARAVPPASLALLAELGALAAPERAALDAFANPLLRNVAGEVVGRLAAGPDTIATVSASLGLPSLPKE
jgi:L-asparaginase II